MRMIFSLVGLLIVVAIVGLIAKKQLSAVVTLPASAVTSTTATPANIVEQNKQMQTQVKEQLDAAMQAAAAARLKLEATESK